METKIDTQTNGGLTLRRLGPADEEALARLAERDTRRRPTGTLIGVEVEGRLLAAASVENGTVIADPFSRTAEVRRLLEVRTKQLRRREGWRRFGRRRARSALAGSPSGGKLVGLSATDH